MINVFDVFVLLIIIGLGISGYREGLVRGAIKLGGFVITIAVLALCSDTIILRIHEFGLSSTPLVVPLTFIILFIIGMVGFTVLAEVLHGMIHMTPVGFIDSGLGTAFGILKALLLGGIFALALSLSPPDTFFRDQFRTSQTAAPLLQVLSETVPFVKSSVQSLYKRIPLTPEKPEKNENKEDIVPDNII